MNEAMLRAFLDDCKANPEDDAPRLILADWLQEHGATEADRARGEHIRLQVELGRLYPEADSERRSHRCYELQRRHEAEWLGELANYKSSMRTWYRGLLNLSGAVSTLTAPRFVAMTRGPGWKWIDRVSVTGGAVAPRLWKQEYLAGVAGLSFRLRPAAFAAILKGLTTSPHLGRLTDLGLEAPVPGEELRRLAGWAGLGRLLRLTLRVGSGGEAGLLALLGSGRLGPLQSLALAHERLGPEVFPALAGCPELAGLVVLYAGGNRYDGAAVAGLPTATFGRSLRHLDLSGNPLGDAGLAHLARSGLPALRYLNLFRVGVGTAGLAALAEAAWLPGLDVLDLRFNALEDAGALLRAPARKLRCLMLDSCQLTAGGLRDLPEAAELGALRYLNLSRNPLGGAVGEVLAACANLPGLRLLGLDGVGLDDEGAAALARWPGLARLLWLGLSENRLTDAGVRALLDSPHAPPHACFGLRGNPVSEALRKHLSEVPTPPLYV